MTSTEGCHHLALSAICFIWLTLAAISTANAQCPPGEEFRTSGSACEGCGDNKCLAILDKAKCYCKPGYCRDSTGRCILPPKSRRSAECPPGEEFLQGGPACEGCEFRCHVFAETHKCYCKSGYCRKSENSSCTLKTKSRRDAECPSGEVFLPSGPVCEGCGPIRCDSFADIPKCYCKPGFCRDGDKCIPQTRSRRSVMDCPKNEVHSDCVVPCNDCYTKGQCAFLVCNKGCDCRKGYYRDDTLSCIPEAQCPTTTPGNK